jgi:hypothetical protein
MVVKITGQQLLYALENGVSKYPAKEGLVVYRSFNCIISLRSSQNSLANTSYVINPQDGFPVLME